MLRLTTAAVIAVALISVGTYVVFHLGPTGNPTVPQAQAGDQFASDRTGPAVPVAFDGDRAMKYLRALCDIGPRISGSDGMQQQQALLKKHFEALGGKVELQPFEARQLSQERPVKMANLIVSWFPERTRRVIFCCHYDTRPIADQEPNERRWHDPFISANDGGSGVAWMMELAHHMKDLKCQVGIDFVIFDGEEYVFEPKEDKYFFGSEHFAQECRKRMRGGKTHGYVAGILLDMMGGKNPRFPQERNSLMWAEPLVGEVWSTAAELKSKLFVRQVSKGAVDDDHKPLNEIAGIPTIDLIDFDYPHWHRLSDTPEQCSGETLEDVGKVLTLWVQRVK
jgi:hypothetical protein